MAEKVKLQRTVQEKDELAKVVNKKFNTFIQPEVEEDTDTIEDLFRLYDKFYLDIPLEGPKSHTYIITESSKLVSIEEEQDIAPLLQEITDLRQRLLEANEQISELENQ
jgi:hypothetical protein